MIRLTEKTTNCAQAATTLTLPWSLRIKSRQRVQLDDGQEAGLFLARGVVLRGGDCLSSDDGCLVMVKAALETVSTVRCSDPLQLARICYHLGNRHVDLEISATRVCYPHDHVLDAMIEGLGLVVEVEQASFEPETGAYGERHGHQHQ